MFEQDTKRMICVLVLRYEGVVQIGTQDFASGVDLSIGVGVLRAAHAITL